MAEGPRNFRRGAGAVAEPQAPGAAAAVAEPAAVVGEAPGAGAAAAEAEPGAAAEPRRVVVVVWSVVMMVDMVMEME